VQHSINRQQIVAEERLQQWNCHGRVNYLRSMAAPREQWHQARTTLVYPMQAGALRGAGRGSGGFDKTRLSS